MKSKSVVSMAIVIAMAVLCIGGNAFAVLNGDGTEANPYLIQSRADFDTFAIAANSATYWASGKYTKLMCDLDLGGTTYTGALIAPDTSTTSGFQGTQFTGILDGNGHVVSNLTITASTQDYIGLFGYIGSGGQIKNLGSVDGHITGRSNVGALCGRSYGAITSCYTTGTVTGSASYVGGLAGMNYTGTITTCYATCAVSGGSYAGGLCGDSLGAINQSHATGTVTGTSYVGGLCGDNSYTISQSYATGAVTGTSYVGGLAGYNNNSKTIVLSYATGAVTGSSYVGGLCGYNYIGRLRQCYATGAVTGTGDYVGGLCGYMDTATISQSYCTGLVTGSSSFVGGLCGGYYNYTNDMFNSCFWDTQTSGKTTSRGGVGKTTAQMQNVNTFLSEGWDFLAETANGTCDYWMLPAGGGYPVLAISQGIIPLEPAGDGTEEEPYVIADANGLGTIWYRPSAYYVLANDIDLVGIQWGMAVVPDFSGVMDGKGFCIRNLCIVNGTGKVLGLFGWAKCVKNLDLENCTITGDSTVGTLAGGNTGSISNCHVTGSVSGNWTGGLCGTNSGTISNCSAATTVTGSIAKGFSYYIGGLTGANNGTISNCYSTGAVIGAGQSEYLGGLVGWNQSGNVSNCYSTSTVTCGSGNGLYIGGLVGENYASSTIANSCSDGATSGLNMVGGLVGRNYSGSIANCYSNGAASGVDMVGGLVGQNYGSVHDCYSTGGVIGQTNVGGLTGWNNSAISNCYSTGAVSGSSYVGGLVGISWGYQQSWQYQCNWVCNEYGDCWQECTLVPVTVPVEDKSLLHFSFWDIDRSGKSQSSGGEGKTTPQMKTISTYTSAGWDFTNEILHGTNDLWRMCTDGADYPRLNWQSAYGDFACPNGINIEDLSVLVQRWLSSGCNSSNNFCGNTDINASGTVDMMDYAMMAQHWLEGI
jgi:hypothetical protein